MTTEEMEKAAQMIAETNEIIEAINKEGGDTTYSYEHINDLERMMEDENT